MLIRRYIQWLHTQWPAGHVERLPLVGESGVTNVPGLYVVGDITGIPLLKFSADTGARAVQHLAADLGFQKRDQGANHDGKPVLDVAIVGAGVSGMAAALEAKKKGLSFALIEATEAFSTVVNFPKGKPIYTYPTDMTPAGELQFSQAASVKESLVAELHAQTLEKGIRPIIARAERIVRRGRLFEIVVPQGDNIHAHRVVVGIGRSGNFRKLGVPGEGKGKVYNRLHDPKDFCEQDVLIVGGGDSALETAIAVASCGARVTVSYRKPEFSRPKPENVEKLKTLAADPTADVSVEEPVSERVTTSAGAFMHEHRRPGSIRLLMASKLKDIRDDEVVITRADGEDETIPNDSVFSMIGREAPLDFFRRSGVRIRGEWRASTWVGFVAFLSFCFWMYHSKTGKPIPLVGPLPTWLSPNPAALWSWLGSSSGWMASRIEAPSTLIGTLKISASDPSFYYTFVYSLAVVIFGIRRIRRRKTPYVTAQTLTLMAIQCVPLFILPEILLPFLGNGGFFDDGLPKTFADWFFPVVGYGHGREYWRAYGFILAWPLMAWNFFTSEPLWAWLILGSIQTLVIIPTLIYFLGKGAYCGWICPCGALAETMGDTHRHKMPHGPKWNRLNVVGQVVLVWSVLLMMVRLLGWAWPDSIFDEFYQAAALKLPFVNYKWLVDIMLAGVIGYGFYFWFSGRVWCRFACPLAALMHVYARFSRFRILADKKKCISCNICTSVCHQGIDIMNFANKGLPMEDPECVRCSACVQSCPTGVLTFGQIDRKTGRVLSTDRLPASRVQMVELTVQRQA